MKKYALIRYTLCLISSIICFIFTGASMIVAWVSAKLFEADNLDFKTTAIIVGISCIVSFCTVTFGAYLNYLKNYYSELYDYYASKSHKPVRHCEITPWYEYVIE